MSGHSGRSVHSGCCLLPPAGKSTLINALVGQKLSIVSWKPQTTRHRIMGIASDVGYQVGLIFYGF